MRKLALVAVIGLAAQLVDGALGMAYGATSTSLLLSAGLAPAVVSATVHLAEIGTTAASGAAHWRFRNVDWVWMEPRKVIGSVDTSEFAVALGASAGFLVGLGAERIDFGFAAALLAGGLVAAPIAAYLVKILPPRLLGAAVGGLIVLTNGRTLGEALGASGEQITTLTVIVAVLWAASVAVAIAAVRREPEPA